jgi:hypothetical protein
MEKQTVFGPILHAVRPATRVTHPSNRCTAPNETSFQQGAHSLGEIKNGNRLVDYTF